jgi:hypothetical protein
MKCGTIGRVSRVRRDVADIFPPFQSHLMGIGIFTDQANSAARR